VSSVGSFFSYVKDARSHEPEGVKKIGIYFPHFTVEGPCFFG